MNVFGFKVEDKCSFLVHDCCSFCFFIRRRSCILHAGSTPWSYQRLSSTLWSIPSTPGSSSTISRKTWLKGQSHKTNRILFQVSYASTSIYFVLVMLNSADSFAVPRGVYWCTSTHWICLSWLIECHLILMCSLSVCFFPFQWWKPSEWFLPHFLDGWTRMGSHKNYSRLQKGKVRNMSLTCTNVLLLVYLFLLLNHRLRWWPWMWSLLSMRWDFLLLLKFRSDYH